MKWKIIIEGKTNLRIIVDFLPLTEQIRFTGQYKRPNLEWVDFCVEEHSMDIDLIQINQMLEKTYDILKKRLDAFNNIDEGFKLINVIEVKED